MQKISSILPASPRVKSVDLAESHPVRPGTPTFGRPVGNSTPAIEDKLTLSQQALGAAQEAELLTYKNPREARGAKIAEDLTQAFFNQRLQPEESKPLAEKALKASEEATKQKPQATPTEALSDLERVDLDYSI